MITRGEIDVNVEVLEEGRPYSGSKLGTSVRHDVYGQSIIAEDVGA